MTSTYFSDTVTMTTTVISTLINSTSSDPDDMDHHDDEIDGDYTGFKIQIKPYVAAIDVIAGLGVIGNILTIILMTSSTLRRHSYAIYLIFLAVMDTLVLFMISVDDNTDHIFDKLDTMFNTHIIICKTWTFLQECVKILSPWILVAMTFDRYIVVVFPLYKVRVCTVKYALTVCTVLCAISIILNSPYLYYLGYLPTDETKEGIICDTDNIIMHYYYMTSATLIQSVLPVIMLVIVNIQTAVILRRAAKSSLRRTKSGKSLDEAKLLKITISLILVSALSAIALVPFAVVSLVEYIYILSGGDMYAIELLSNLWMFFNVIRLLNYAMNFYVLVSFSDHYRRILGQKFACVCRRRQIRESANTSSMALSMNSLKDTSISTITDTNSAL